MKRIVATRSSLLIAAATLLTLQLATASIGPSSKTRQDALTRDVAASRAKAPTINPGIAPPNSKPHGQSYGAWGVQWWQWVLAIPADRNPLTDPDGRFCGEDQSGPVWFLAGSFGDSVERSCTIPVGKAIFMPVFNWLFGAGAFDCEPSVPEVPCDVSALQASAAANTENAEIVDVTINGVTVQNVRQYRGISPAPFSVTYPDNSVVGLPAGTYYPQISDGYWLMLNPLSKGGYTIRVRVLATDTTSGPIDFTNIFHITIQ